MKITEMILIYLAVYLPSAFICYGLDFGYYQGSFTSFATRKYQSDRACAIGGSLIIGALGPIGILVVLLMTGFGKYGFKIK